jgi:hypothetical protein
MKLIRLFFWVLVIGLGVWVGRLMAHSKVPPPEGRWREIAPEELRAAR